MSDIIKVNWTLFGERVHQARRRRKMTQEALAERIGVSRTTMGAIEYGTTAPSYAIVMSLCAVLDVVEPPYQMIEDGEI